MRSELENVGDKQIGYGSFVLFPRLAILDLTSLDVSNGSVGDHSCKEKRIEPRERAIEPRYQTPGQGKVQVARVMYLACVSICK